MNHTARNFALQLGSLATLYISLGSLLALLFALINLSFPDATDSYWQIESATESIRFAIAMLVVFFPAYLVLTRRVNEIRRDDQTGAYLSITKWLVYLSLLVAGGILLGDLVSVIYTFLNGEITIRFIFKVIAILVVIGGAFYYYIKDAQGYWKDHEKQSISIGFMALGIVIISLILGFMKIETPESVREMRLDVQQVSDLQDIQWRIEDYYRANESLPENLTLLYTGEAPSAPENRADYIFEITSTTGYKLCARFAYDSSGDDSRAYPSFEKNYNWEYLSGDRCFDRTVPEEELR